MSSMVHTEGAHPETATLRNSLASAGLLAPHTKKPFSEAMLLGLGGGVGLSYHVMQYGGGFPSAFYVSGRHSQSDNVAFMRAICDRLGVGNEIHETGGAKAAVQQLRDALAEPAPPIAWVDWASLPYSGLPPQLRRMTYHVINVYALDGDTATVGDLPKKPLTITAAELGEARAAIKSQKFRLLTLTPPKAVKALPNAVRDGIADCVRGMTAGKSWNTRIDALAQWADRLERPEHKEAYLKIFPPGSPLFLLMIRVLIYIDLYGTGGGLMRDLYADFLDEAADVLKKKALAEVATRYRALAKGWSKLAASMLPDKPAPFGEARRLLLEFDRVYRSAAPKAVERQREIVKRIVAIKDEVKARFPLDDDAVTALLTGAAEQLRKLDEGERAALQALAATVK